MYQQYFGLREAPFSIAVNPRYLFMSARHRDALAHLLYGVGSGGGFILLTGEVGTGKTTINRCLLEQLPDTTDLAIVLNPALSAVELLATVCDELGIDYPDGTDSLKALTDALHGFLLANHAAGRRTVLLIDEAQHLDFDVLEQIRLLTNLETNDEKLLQIILIGQPELTEKLSRPELRQLNQRITARYTLEPLNVDETAAYIRHRLEVAGLPGGTELFPPGVVRAIHRRTRGIPRLINLLCDRTLLGAYGRKLSRVDNALVRSASAEVLGESSGRGAWRGRVTPVLVGGVLLAVLATALIVFIPDWRPDSRDGRAAAMASDEPSTSLRPAGAPADAASMPAPATTTSTTPSKPPSNSALPSTADTRLPGWLLAPAQAEATLWRYSTDAPFPGTLCGAPAELRLRCSTASAPVWEDLTELGRPVLLDMVTPQRFSATTLVLEFVGSRAVVAAASGSVTVPLVDLARYWQGNYRYLWRVPENWQGPVSAGDSGAMVAEIARLFAKIDGQATPLTDVVFTPALASRVRLFQEAEGLTADGIVGEQTLQRLLARSQSGLTSAHALDRAGLVPGEI